jgi:hypothetical protein
MDITRQLTIRRLHRSCVHGAHIASYAFDCEEIHVSVDALDRTRARVPLRLCVVSGSFQCTCMHATRAVRASNTNDSVQSSREAVYACSSTWEIVL